MMSPKIQATAPGASPLTSRKKLQVRNSHRLILAEKPPMLLRRLNEQ
eukprot:CAMPEP_0115090668 /NCGR_PEP_ID=MMETSP0227-20121206/25581_1 /TAXON_ID=89957 /ORGANISM="Polarella glacialis, Strain CCMP 1383" /LENGTH=46 /DNA_ID= /DNA_START= /DNA_END= /DNA_ORIENTATION=